jgi:hypothetical protein
MASIESLKLYFYMKWRLSFQSRIQLSDYPCKHKFCPFPIEYLGKMILLSLNKNLDFRII